MMYRVVASSAAILGVALVLAPAAVDARGAGFGGGRGFAFHRVRPAFHQHMLFGHRFFGRSNFPLSTFGTGFGYGGGYGGGDAGYSTTYPVMYGLYDLPPPPWATWPTPVAAAQAAPRVCTTEVRKVPSEEGGERAITIRRC